MFLNKSLQTFGFCLLILQCAWTLEFKMKIVSITKCVRPDDSFDKENMTPFDISAYKADRQNTLVRANFSIRNRVGPIHIVARTFEIIHNSVENFVVEINMPCSHVFVLVLIEFLKLRTAPPCYLLPGAYALDNLNIEKFTPFMDYVWKYGRYGTELELRSPKGIISCCKIVIDFVKKRR